MALFVFVNWWMNFYVLHNLTGETVDCHITFLCVSVNMLLLFD